MCLISLCSSLFHFLGAINVYVRLQTILWWLFQNLMMLYGVVRPLQYRFQKDSGKLKYFHLSSVAAGIVLPLIPVLISQWIGGYSIAVELNYSCVPRNIVYYVFVPATVCAIIGVSILLYIGSEFAIKVCFVIIAGIYLKPFFVGEGWGGRRGGFVYIEALYLHIRPKVSRFLTLGES